MKKILLILIVFSQTVAAQNFKFGKVKLKDYNKKSYAIDTTANAIILYSEVTKNFDLENSKIEENYVMRIKILNKEGFDYATKSIHLYESKSQAEKVSDIKAFTYNLDHGRVIKTKLKKSNVYNKTISKNHSKTVFTMPNIKEGSIVEWKYTISTPFIMYTEFVIQHSIPVLYSKIQFDFPKLLGYVPHPKGYQYLNFVKTVESRSITFNTQKSFVTKDFDFNIHTIVTKNVPALKDEPYSGNIDNYRLGVEYELKYYEKPDFGGFKDFSTTWEKVIKAAYESDDFGKQLKKTHYLKSDIITVNNFDSINKINQILELCKDNIKWNGDYDYTTSEGVIKAYNNGVGNVAEVNLNMINLLNATGYSAYPVLVSTVSHGIPVSPSGKAFNYVIAGVKEGENLILLDATEENSMPNVLPMRVYNFTGFLIDKSGAYEEVNLFPTTYSVQKVAVNVTFTEDGFKGIAQKKLNRLLALRYRKYYREKRKDELKKIIEENYEDLDVLRYRISNLDKLHKDIKEVVQFETESFYEDISGSIYINPLLYWQDKSPLFVSKERKFPVFFNYLKYDETDVNITIPDNYEVVSLPETETIEMADKSVQYIYKVTKNGNVIHVSALYLINSVMLSAEKYQELKKLYEDIIKKQDEKIVIKPKN